ncbi:MAG: acetyl-CoA synthase subunit gamma, partial [Paeniclostridium sordellii]|nr:acetyl-CoA synthase subunit gamma [Paeniclostridium sordellii]
DAGGYSVLTAWAAGKFSGSSIANFIKESKVSDMTKNRDLIIPGKVAVLKGDIEDNLPGWNVIIGTEESMEVPKFLREYKANQEALIQG